MRHIFIIVILMFSVLSRAEISATSIGDLYEIPGSYSGKVVEIIGWLDLHFEGDVVCESRDLISADCVEVELDQRELYNSFSGEKIRVVGQFYRVNLDYSPVTREGGTLRIQLGPNFHKIGNVTTLKVVKTTNK